MEIKYYSALKKSNCFNVFSSAYIKMYFVPKKKKGKHLNHTKDSDQPTVFKYLITLFIQKHRHQFKTILTEREYKIDYF
jgi:hypothetical protein